MGLLIRKKQQMLAVLLLLPIDPNPLADRLTFNRFCV